MGWWNGNYGKTNSMENLQGTSPTSQSSHVLDQLWVFKCCAAPCGIITQHQRSKMAYKLKQGSSTTAVWTFAQYCWLKRDGYLCTEEQVEVNLLIAPGIAQARNYPEESSLNYFVLTGVTHGLAGEYSKPFCVVVNKVNVFSRELH